MVLLRSGYVSQQGSMEFGPGGHKRSTLVVGEGLLEVQLQHGSSTDRASDLAADAIDGFPLKFEVVLDSAG